MRRIVLAALLVALAEALRDAYRGVDLRLTEVSCRRLENSRWRCTYRDELGTTGTTVLRDGEHPEISIIR